MDAAGEVLNIECGPGGLWEGCSPQQRVFDGKVLPKILCCAASGLPDALHILAHNKAFIEEQVLAHGAVLLRGLPLQGAADFDSVVRQAFGWQEVPYVGKAIRQQVVGRALTSTATRPDLAVPFHHEMTEAVRGPPSKILFFCDIEPTHGGETPLVLSHKIEEKMREEFPDFVEKLEEEGIFHITTVPPSTDASLLIGRGWPAIFATNDRVEAEKRAQEHFGARVVWLPNGHANIIGGPYKAIKSLDKNRPARKQWFNLISFAREEDPSNNEGNISNMDERISFDGLYTIVFQDGKPLPKQAIARSKELLEHMSVDIPWKRGDIMIIDNLAVMHGRRPCYNPRRILVALCD